MEQYLTYPVQARPQDRFAEGLLQTLVEIAPGALAEPPDYDHRANLMWTATLALNGLIGAGVPQDWATHMIGHELTALHGIDHAPLHVRAIGVRELQYPDRFQCHPASSVRSGIDAGVYVRTPGIKGATDRPVAPD